MQRRTFLEAGVGAVGAALTLGTVSGQEEPAFEPLSSLDIPGATEVVVHPNQEIVYVAVGDGIAAVDIAANQPEIVAEDRELETDDGLTMAELWDCWLWEDRLILAGPANGGSAGRGFGLYDISTPESPERLTIYESDTFVHNSSFDDGVVYLTGSGLPDQPLVMVDVSDDDPTEVGRFSISDADEAWGDVSPLRRDLHDVHVHDGIAYMAHWDAGTWLVDVSDPTDPEVLSSVGEYSATELSEATERETAIGRIVPPGNDHVTTVDDDATVLAVGEEAWAVSLDDERQGGAGGVRLYDISDRTNPQELAKIEPPESHGQTQTEWFTTAHNLDIDGDRLLTSWYFGGVKIHDISDPANPEEIAWWRDPTAAAFWTVQSAGDTIVASSINIQSKIGAGPNATRDALFVFPNQAGTQPDAPSLTDPDTDSSNDDPDDDNANPDGDNDGNSADGSADDRTDDSEEGSDDDGPGFGIGAAALGAVGAGYALSRRQGDEE